MRFRIPHKFNSCLHSTSEAKLILLCILMGNNRLRRFGLSQCFFEKPKRRRKIVKRNTHTNYTKLTNTICNSIKKAALVAANNSLRIKYSFRMPNFINAKQILLPKKLHTKYITRKKKQQQHRSSGMNKTILSLQNIVCVSYV